MSSKLVTIKNPTDSTETLYPYTQDVAVKRSDGSTVKSAIDGLQNNMANYTPTAGFATINGSSITGGGNVSIIAAEGQTITIDASPTDGSNNAVSSNGVYDAIEGGFYV